MRMPCMQHASFKKKFVVSTFRRIILKIGGGKEMAAAMAEAGDAVTAVLASVDAAGPSNGNAHSRRLEPSAVDSERSWSVDSKRSWRRRRRLRSRLRSRESTWRSRSREPGAYLEDKEGEGS